MYGMLKIYVILISVLANPALCEITLEQYNIDPASVTVSGISSGAAFATQYHVIHSTEVVGAAMFAGVVYHCANGIYGTALLCMSAPYLTNVDSLIDKTVSLAEKGSIDPTSGMEGDKVYIFAGTKDTVVRPANGKQIDEFYIAFDANTKTEYEIPAQHCQPTDSYGQACDYLGGNYINNCTYNGAFEALNFVYGNSLLRPDFSVSLKGQFSEFDQGEFYPGNSPWIYSADTTGFIYVPSRCMDKSQTCKLHFAFHGCLQGREYLDDTFAKQTGYLETAELNNIIVVFPQVIHTFLTNPSGCWDWWGYTGYATYATKKGPQITATSEMIERLISG